MSLQDYHYLWMPLNWLVLINVWIIAGTFSSSKIGIYIHVLGCLAIIIMSFMCTISLARQNVGEVDPQEGQFYFHVVFGCLCLAAMLYQYISGALTKLSNKLGFKSVHIVNLKRFHMILGLIITVLLKIQAYKMLKQKHRAKYYIYDIISLAIYIAIKLFKPTLTYDSSLNSHIKGIRSVNSLLPLMNQASIPCVYGNYIYDLSSLDQWHPAGLEIIESVKYSEIEKYLFGIYSSAKIPSIRSYAHSKMSLNLLEEPIARLEIPSNFKNINKQNIAYIHQLRALSKSVYEMHLRLQNIEFEPYSHIKQLGRYYCFTLNNQVTRLYTCVNFLHFKNISFLQKYLKPSKTLQQYFSQRKCYSQSIPILFKHYKDGFFTDKLINPEGLRLSISEQQGLGFQLDEVEHGEIVLIAGGTGIFPYLDLIDLLFKEHIAMKDQQAAQIIYKQNPILKGKVLHQYKFKIYAAFQSIQEIHPIVMQMFRQLHNSSKVQIVLNVKQPKDKSNLQPFNFTGQRFETIAMRQLQNKSVSKVYICGPPKMNQRLTASIQKQYKDSNRYLIY